MNSLYYQRKNKNKIHIEYIVLIKSNLQMTL